MGIINEFSGYIGQTIKNPDRVTCDVDELADEIRQKASNNGLMAAFIDNTKFSTHDAPKGAVIIKYGTDTNEYAARQVIKGIDILWKPEQYVPSN